MYHKVLGPILIKYFSDDKIEEEENIKYLSTFINFGLDRKVFVDKNLKYLYIKLKLYIIYILNLNINFYLGYQPN